MNSQEPLVPIWVTWIVALSCGAIFAAVSWALTDQSWRSEVVRRGFAKWTVVSDAGQTKFEWIK